MSACLPTLREISCDGGQRSHPARPQSLAVWFVFSRCSGNMTSPAPSCLFSPCCKNTAWLRQGCFNSRCCGVGTRAERSCGRARPGTAANTRGGGSAAPGAGSLGCVRFNLRFHNNFNKQLAAAECKDKVVQSFQERRRSSPPWSHGGRSAFLPAPRRVPPGSPSAPAPSAAWSPSPGAPPQRCSSPRSSGSQS